ncbi:hypothetical protein PRIPAC_72648 [Pristionchus pacificus]|uniref:Uncharacterized protein n=1 Tax=Pristionchus pacificus TaxID=54126 RepID=A0A2A6C0L3_PRIPA|nr:hypothetical protein PRIPAC_72648 [Pristionchus pacificus]|eukprot:PDM71571.1 hypothetical protein PRIPAC_37978 [Pristionchus pacificus]
MVDDREIDRLVRALAAKCGLLKNGDPLGIVFAATTDLLLATAKNGLDAKNTKYALERLTEEKERAKSLDKKTNEAERSLVYGLSDLIVIMFKKLENRQKIAEFEAIMNKRTIASNKEPMFTDDSLWIVDVVDISQPVNKKRRNNFFTMDFSNQLDDFDSLDENENLIIENQPNDSTNSKSAFNMSNNKSPAEASNLGNMRIMSKTPVNSEDQRAIESNSIDNEQPPPASTTHVNSSTKSIKNNIGDVQNKIDPLLPTTRITWGQMVGKRENLLASRKRHWVDPSSMSERKFQCDVCMKYMLTSTHLRDHKLIHTGERPEKCKVKNCSAAFATAAKLLRHMRNSHHINQFKCNNCNIVFKKKFELIKHYEQVGCHREDSERYIIPK